MRVLGGCAHNFRRSLPRRDGARARLPAHPALPRQPSGPRADRFAGGLQMRRTWSLSPELAGEDAIDGRDRLDLTGFPGSEVRAVTETEAAITVEQR